MKQYIENVEQLRLAWKVMCRAGDPNLRIAFNSLGAHASMPDLHWQLYYNSTSWQVPFERVAGVAGLKAGVHQIDAWLLRFTTVFKGIGAGGPSLEDVYAVIDQIHKAAQREQNKIAFNLLLMPDAIVVLPRAHQAVYIDYMNGAAPFTTGPAWLEVLGTWIVPARDGKTPEEIWRQTTTTDIKAMYGAISLDSRPFAV